MKIRYFQNTDAESLLQLWNRAHPRYPLTAQLMAKKIFLDPNFTEKDLLVLEEK